MPRNGSGTFSLVAGNPVTTGTTISSTWANTTLSDISSALTTSISSDGQTTPSANLPMGGFAHTGVANASVRTQYASAAQVQDGALEYLGAVSGTDTITASAAVGMTAYTVGQTFRFVAAGANTTTAVTININGIGAKNITKNGATALAIGDISSGAALQIVYDGTQFQVTGIAGGVSSFSAGSTGLTPSTATNGAVTLAGTLASTNGGTGLTTFTAANNALYSTGAGTLTAGTLPVAAGGTNNASLAVTAGGTLYTDGTKLVNVGAGTSGQFLKSNGASAPTWAAASTSGSLLNIQYFTATATYTPTSGTNYVVVEVWGGGGGGGVQATGGNGGTTSFGSLIQATGGGGGVGATPTGGAAGVGSLGDYNLTAGAGGQAAGGVGITGFASGGSIYGNGVGMQNTTPGRMGATVIPSVGGGANNATSSQSAAGGGGGGYARKKITSAFSGVSVTVGAAGTANGTGAFAGGAGQVIVYEYA